MLSVLEQLTTLRALAKASADHSNRAFDSASATLCNLVVVCHVARTNRNGAGSGLNYAYTYSIGGEKLSRKDLVAILEARSHD